METQNFSDRQYIYKHNEEAQKSEETRLKRAMAGAVLAIITIAGLAYQSNKNDQPDKVSIETEDIKKGETPKGEKIEIDGLAVGSTQEVVEGIFEIDPKERNVRKSPRVVNPDTSGGDSNLYKLNGKITVVDPIISDRNIDGVWGMAADSDGSKYYFVLDTEGITNVETGKSFSFNDVNTFKAEIEATTTMGNVGKDKAGEDHLVATLVDIKE
jgi:hypothetical protein